MRWNHAWLSCQSVPGPPFGGITRIRFKGSAPKQFGALSATRLPRTFFLAQNKTDTSEVNDEQLQAVCYGRSTNPQSGCDSAVESFRNAVSRQVAIDLLPALRSCGKW